MQVLSKVKGLDFPIEKEPLKERLGGIVLNAKKIEEILDELEYPIKSPAELLHRIKMKLNNNYKE